MNQQILRSFQPYICEHILRRATAANKAKDNLIELSSQIYRFNDKKVFHN